MPVILRPEQLQKPLTEAPARPLEVRVLMADPAFFDVAYVINPHMAENIGSVDPVRARQQWEAVREAYTSLGFPVSVIPPVEGLPDLVFMANQSFPGQLPDGRWAAVRSFMKSVQRRPEVAVVCDWYMARDALILDLAETPVAFEGMGDAVWVPGHRAIVGGYGFRTALEAYVPLAAMFDVPVLALELTDPRFYHLDTCLQLLGPETALIVREAFTPTSIALVEAAFPVVVDIPLTEGLNFAGNGHSPDGRHFLVQRGNPVTEANVRSLGLEVISLDTSEFMKSGGSVFCMKLMIP